MQILPLLGVASQNFQAILNDHTWDITLKIFESGSAFVSILIDDTPLVYSLRMTPNLPCLFDDRLAQYGQLYLYVPDGESLSVDRLGVTQQLVYDLPV